MPNKSETPITFDELARLIGERKRYFEQAADANKNIGKLKADLEKETEALSRATALLISTEDKIKEVGKGL